MKRTIDEKDICNLYLNGEFLKDIAEKYGYSTTYTIKQILIKNNIPIRNASQNTSLYNKKNAKKKNIKYFDTQSHNMAWLLGFIAADGCVYQNKNEIKIGLSSVDREILEKIKEELQIENKICDYETNNGFLVSELRWTCAEHKQKLFEYGIIPNKTFCLGLPLKLKKEYYIDYIRGYFDGDGSINLIQNGNALRWQICSATSEILNWIVNFFHEEYGISKVNIQEWKRKHSLYSIQYSTNATKQIYKILYNGNLCLERKYKHYTELINDKKIHETPPLKQEEKIC